jgi:hypothetical protein
VPKLTWSDTPCANGHIGWRRVTEGVSRGVKYRHTKCEQCRKDNRAKHRHKDIGARKRTLINNLLASHLLGRKRQARQSKAEALLGCSIEFYRCYIQSQFTSEMTWDNRNAIWQIDHIEECYKFDLNDPLQVQKCFHYTNTRPRITANNIWQGKKSTI